MNKNNQRKFLDNLAIKLNIETPRDWGNITIQKVAANGGISLLGIYQHSLFRTLKGVYTGWHSFSFESLHVKNMSGKENGSLIFPYFH